MILTWTSPITPQPPTTSSSPPTNRTNSAISDAVNDLLVYNEPYQKLICAHHGYAIRNLAHHLNTTHQHSLSLSQRRALIAQYQHVHIDRVPCAARPFQAPIAGLAAPVHAYLCQHDGCFHVSKHIKGIRQHAHQHHQWRRTVEQPSSWIDTQAQTFFADGGHVRYFPVQFDEVHDAPPPSHPLSDEAQIDLAEIQQTWSAARDKHVRRLAQIDEEITKQDKTGWFNRTEWPQHLAGRNIKHLSHASRLPDRDESLVQEVDRLVQLMMSKAVQGLSSLDLELRRWLRSAKASEPDVRPLNRLQDPESHARYHSYFQRFACYLTRIWLSEQEVCTRSVAQSASSAGSLSSNDNDSDSDSNCEGDDDLMKDARELFPWTLAQRRVVTQLMNQLQEGDTTDDVRIRLMVQVFQAFIFHQVGGRPYDSALVHFLAVLGIDDTNNRLRRAPDYSYILAGLVYNMRVLGADILSPSITREAYAGLSNADHELSARHEFLHQRRTYLADGSGTPMSYMISLLAYSKHIALNTGNSGSVTWSQDKQTMYFRGHPVELAMFQKMIQDAVTRAENLLWQELMWVTDFSERSHVDLKDIVDDVTFTRRGISFLSRSRNGLTGGLDWMLTRMLSLQGQQRLRVNGKWQWRRIRRYLRRSEDFLELLLFIIHTTGGQPARGTEVCSIRFRNGCFQDRNVFIIDGEVVVITRYHKSQSLFDRPKIIPRFLPARVGQLLVQYLSRIQPLREHLMDILSQSGWSDYIWHDTKGPMPTDRLTKIIKRETALGIRHAWTTLDYRHIAVSIGRVVVGQLFASGFQDEVGEVDEPEVEEESALELQSGRSETVGSLKYGVPVNIIQHLSTRTLETFRPLSQDWHRFLGLHHDDAGPVDRVRPTEKRIAAVTPRPPTSVVGLRPTNDDQRRKRPMEVNESSPSLPLSKRPCSDSPSPFFRSSCPPLVPDEASSSQQLHSALQTLFKTDSVSFQSREQEEGVQAVLQNETPLVVVLPTGGGKTLLAMLPTLIEREGVSIVVAPFRALVDNMVERFRRSHIDCFEWRFGEVNPARVIIVSADIAASFGFLNYARLLQQSGLLRRIFIDECHLTFTSSDWRPKLAQLRHLRALECPMVLLTATLPPLLTYELEEAMLVRNARYIRQSTIRPRHRYHVQRCRAGELHQQALDLCRRRAPHLGSHKGVIYCRSRGGCEALAEELDCVSYHAGQVDRAEKLKQWSERGGLMVATSALGTGVDFPGIIFVLHVDMPWTMIDFAQESGRAGRGGELVDSIILVEENTVENRVQGGTLSVDGSAMASFITTTGCRRWTMSEYLDGMGRGQRCSEVPGGSHCDRCGDGLSELQQRVQQDAREWSLIKPTLDDMAEGCAVCWVLGEEGLHADHSLEHCTKWPGANQAEMDRFRRQIRYTENSHSCTRCGFSQKLCATGVDGQLPCQWPNVLTAVVRCAMGSEIGRGLVRRCGWEGLDDDLGGYGRWLGRRHVRRRWGEWMSNAMVVLTEVVLYLLQDEPRG